MATNRRHLSLALLAAVLGAVLLLPAGASAAACDSRDMIDAAANGRQITTHTAACYQQAIAELPSDVDGYAPEIRSNLIAARDRDANIKSQLAGHDGRQLAAAAAGLPTASATAPAVRGPVASLLEQLGPAHVDQVPIPVVALALASALLLLAGLGTSLSRVRQRRLSR
ncbi:MAG: hypothetical protein QOK36_300 [Gaiellales bacterium]|nr:hypothetical protein [Gaiellales bacterium]